MASIDQKLLKNVDYLKKLKNFNIGAVIDHLISRQIISELEYRRIWDHIEIDRVDALCDILNVKNDKERSKFFDILGKIRPDSIRAIREAIKNDELDVNFKKGFVLSDSPILPPNYIERTDFELQIKKHLRRLLWNEQLVVYGMLGYGKSSLICNIFQDRALVNDCFNNRWFWVKPGENQLKENVLQPMWRLYSRAITLTKKTPLSHCPEDIERLKDCLKDVFLDDNLKDAVVILDNVNHSLVTDAFNIGCKLIITTQFKDILKNISSAHHVEINKGFTRTESLSVFKKCLETESINFESKAEQIHDLCKGHPMIVSLIGSILKTSKDRATRSPKIWDYLIEKLSTGNYEELGEYDIILKNANETIKMWLENENLTSPTLRSLFNDLAVFEKDVNIIPEVLEILWNMDDMRVRRVMVEFESRSLIASSYNKQNEQYVYGIHDLHFNYLKNATKNCQKELHAKLINGYDKLTDKDYSKLPHDNYTLQYIGHHLLHAQMFERFDIYFDLRFIEHKIKSLGVMNILQDINIYRSYITRNDPSRKKKLEDYEKFIKICGGDLYNYDQTDILQCALQTDKRSSPYQDAIQIIQRNKNNDINNLYFSVNISGERYKLSRLLKLEDQVTTACFSTDHESILVGTASGAIKLFCHEYQKELEEFRGHRGKILGLQVKPNLDNFLSVSEDRHVKVWTHNFNHKKTDPRSPKIKQSPWTAFYASNDEPRGECVTLHYNEDNDYLISASMANNYEKRKRVISGTKKGKIIIWDCSSQPKVEKSIPPSGLPARCVMFSADDSLVIFTRDSCVFIHRADTMIFLCQLHSSDPIDALFVVPNCNKAVAITNRSVMQFQWKYNQSKGIIEYPEAKKIVDGSSFLCAAMTSDAKYLVAGTEEHSIFLWDIESLELIQQLKDEKRLPISLDTSYNSNEALHILLISFDNKTIEQCHIKPQQDVIVDTFWNSNFQPTLALVTPENKVQIQRGCDFNTETQTVDNKITHITFSSDGSKVLYALANGQVMEFMYKTNLSQMLFDLGSPVEYIKCFKNSSIRFNNTETDSLSVSPPFTAILSSDIVVAATKEYLYMASFRTKIAYSILQVFQMEETFILVDIVGNVSLWNLPDRVKPIRLVSEENQKVTSVCLQDHLMALTFSDGKKHNYVDICSIKGEINTEILSQNLEGTPKSCSLSFCHNLLAIGFTDGKITVFNITNLNNIVLNVHVSSVNCLKFSPFHEPILVSIGSQIAWFNLASFACQERTALKHSPLEESWMHKTHKKDAPYLLQTIKLYGQNAKFCSISEDFKSFLTVDNEGKIYFMEFFDVQ